MNRTVLSRSERARRIAQLPVATKPSTSATARLSAHTNQPVSRVLELKSRVIPEAIKNRFFNQAAFLIGGGPSFLEIDSERLRDSGALTMTLNNAFMSYRSDLWLGVDAPRRFVRDIWSAPEVMKFTPSRHRERAIAGRPRIKAESCPNTYFYEQNEWFKREQMFADHDPAIWDNRNGHGCRTSLMDAIRVLYLLGVRRLYLLGVDFHQSETYSYHYAKNTRGRGVARNNRLYRYMSARLARLRPLMEQAGLQVFNCNPKSKLEAFDYFNLDRCLDRLRVEKKNLSTWHPVPSAKRPSTNQIDVTLITPTGDRPLPFKLCEYWMSKQAFKGSVQWIVVDDGAIPTRCTMGQQYIRRKPEPDDPRHTLARNLLTAIPYVASDKILIIEDDDWYSPIYLKKMLEMLDTADLVGLTNQIYYRINDREWKDCRNRRRASMCQTGLLASVLPTLRAVCEADFRGTDLRLWKAWKGSKRFASHDPRIKLSVGIKQQPGRAGQTSGWRNKPGGYTLDPEGSKLREWIGDDVNAYLEGASKATFLHSGGLGDIVYALPTIQALGGGHLYIKTGVPNPYPDTWGHMGDGVKVTEEMAEALRPLLEGQAGITGCSIYRGQEITYNLDHFRYRRGLSRGHIAQHHLDAFGVTADLTQPWLQVVADESYRDTVIINRTSRYHAEGITGRSYQFCNGQHYLFIGNESEYKALKRYVPSLAYEPTRDFRRVAEMVAGSKLFIGNQSCCYAIAEGLKIDRVLEVCGRIPNCNPIGIRGTAVSTEYQLFQAIEHQKRILLVGADESNPGDKIVEAGCRYRVSQRWTEAEIFFVDIKHPEDAVEADILVVCGTPWLAPYGGPTWRQRSLRAIINASKAGRLEAWGIGAVFGHDQSHLLEDSSVHGARSLFSQFDVVEARDSIAQEIFVRAGVESSLKPCPSIEARHYFGIEPGHRAGRLHIYQSIQTANLRKHILQTPSFAKAFEAAQRRCIEDADVLCYCAQDFDIFRREFPGHDCSLACEPKEILEIISAYAAVTAARVHGALPALSLGSSVTILPMDTRGLAAIYCGARLCPVLKPFCAPSYASYAFSQPRELAASLTASHSA